MTSDLKDGKGQKMDDSDITNKTQHVALANCDVCQSNPFKYRCPACAIQTCSLACVKNHKVVKNCSGTRDKTKFVPVAKFDQLDFASDLNLLQEVSKSLESISKDEIVPKQKHFQGSSAQNYLPHRLFNLWRVARGRSKRNCRLLFLPESFQKRKENSSYFDFKRKCIFWRLNIVFPNIDKTVELENVPETARLLDILWPHLETRSLIPKSNIGTQIKSNKILEEDLFEVFKSVGFPGVDICLKLEHSSHQSARYKELNLKKSLLANLRGTTVVEFPSIIVTLKSHRCYFYPDENSVMDETDKAVEGNSESDATEETNTFGLLDESGQCSDSDDDLEDSETERRLELKRKADADAAEMVSKKLEKHAKKWERPAIDYENSSFLRAYAFQDEQQKEETKEVEETEVQNEEDAKEQYENYFNFYLKYYKGKYGLKEEEKAKEIFKDDKTDQKDSNKPSSALVAYDDSDDE